MLGFMEVTEYNRAWNLLFTEITSYSSPRLYSLVCSLMRINNNPNPHKDHDTIRI